MISDVLGGFVAGVWAMRWPIVVALALWVLSWALEKHRDALRRLAAERARADTAEKRLATLQHATGAMAQALHHSDPTPDWLDGYIAPQWYDGKD